ncbi:MAG: hypothetical protein SW833_27575 [Cyanobacteriota bacterium]|nr:hypothetical protein [Cyanobacteriota bacterium]
MGVSIFLSHDRVIFLVMKLDSGASRLQNPGSAIASSASALQG